MRSIAALAIVLVLATTQAQAQRPATDTAALRKAVRAWRAANEPAVLDELRRLLSIPNVASDSANIRRNADTMVAMFARRGIALRRLESPAGGPPALYGELRSPRATRTVVLYAHYDGQPVDRAQWTGDPWTPVMLDGPSRAQGAREVPFPTRPGEAQDEWRIQARSASDDKAPVIAILAALDALKAAKVAPSVNLKFWFDGEEEAGNEHTAALLRAQQPLLAADAWIFFDGPVHQSRRAQVVFGVRGVMGLELTVYGPTSALHSGHYGNWAPNPIVRLAHLVASMRDEEGRITIAGFADDLRPLDDADRRALATIPAEDSALRARLALARTEAGDALLAERIMQPALNVRSIRGGLTASGAAANAIPTEATASIDFRLVAGQAPERVRERVEAHLRSRGWHLVHEVPDAATRGAHEKVALLRWEPGYAASRTSPGLPASRAIVRVASEAAGAPVVEVPTLGGSLPLAIFDEFIDAPLVVVPIANHDNNQHAANENLRVKNLRDGIELYAFLIARLGLVWR